MRKHEEKHCSRCNSLFECRAGNISACQCSQVVISEALADHIAMVYQDCLCLNCLLELQERHISGKNTSAENMDK